MSRPIGSQKQLERRRQRAIALLKAGWSALAVARKCGCARSAVYAWWTAFRRRGLRGLKARPVPGRPPKLTLRQKRALSRILLAGALSAGYSTDLWTQKRVAKVIQERFGVAYHPNHMWRFLQRLGWSVQKPVKRARERDEKAIAHWKRYTWPHIKKGRTA
jgi:transposase